MDTIRESPLNRDYGFREPCLFGALYLTRRVEGG